MDSAIGILPVTPPLPAKADNERHTDLPESAPPSTGMTEIGPGPFPGFRKPFRSLWWLFHVLLGIGFLLPLLAGLAAIPGLSLLALGFMLEAQAEVGRSGSLRRSFPLLAVSTRVGTICLMVFLFLLPVIAVSSVAEAQAVIFRLSGISRPGLQIATVIVQAVVFVHLLMAIACGGSFLCFLRPLRNVRRLVQGVRSGCYVQSVNEWTDRLLLVFRPWHHFVTAVRGAIGALVWLAIPTALLGAATSSPASNLGPRIIISLIGGILMIPVASWLPLLQCHQAAEGRFRAIFEVGVVRRIIRRVPIRWAVATILLYGLAIPLYLSKVVLPPADAFWLFTPLFIVVIYPTRILMGWVYGQGLQREQDTNILVQWPVRLFMIPMLGLYSLILFALPMISEAGPRAMFENHAFLLPVPSGQFVQ